VGSVFDQISFRSIKDIDHKVDEKVMGHAVSLPGFNSFIDGLPNVLAADGLRDLLQALRKAKELGRPIMWSMGAHSIKCGLTPWLIALAREGFLTSLSINGAAVIHDIELALAAETSEDVEAHLDGGVFGSANEPGAMLGACVEENGDNGEGFGQQAAALLAGERFARTDLSLLAGLHRLDVPVTVHAALGTDTIHFHPALDWGLLGTALKRDFELFIELVRGLDSGGVFVNVGSAVIMPEVFLKALTVARNTGTTIEDFTTANLDMIQHYRPRENVLKRPGGRAIALTGHHEIMIPLLACALFSGEIVTTKGDDE